ncbi:uncharacterized protein BDR25DRAFT_303549 [Lindgomyces ingoldianus]|uniref:Uncharacterized protein n=1 Tax=Lindgomyces ingoldianus TaxID=673940 RepID=A0ACB6QY22_9PLEO|nr:uncharacterized protein BDR25DRAFT_303549 [Lindgomyces ingoldianus]KAF2470975.1 hypothetical protein BDR25DRAFT_303549 [Lindgomyces ingoldianus]
MITFWRRLLSLLPLSLTLSCHAAITVFPSSAEPRAYNHQGQPSAALSNKDLFRQSCPDEFAANKNASVLFSSNSGDFAKGTVYPTSDSFVRGTIDAWGQHQHLVIRPEEVWFSVLAQMNFYMSKNSEALRNLFVDHDGKEEILVEDYTWELVLGRFQYEIQKRVKTPWLLDWIRPNFTTTTETDIMTANVLMMGLMQAYFEFVGGIICGLPSVTLLGEKKDWEKLLVKLDHLTDFGTEPVAYAKQLRPILSRFVRTFDEPDSPQVREFWTNIIHADPARICGGPPYTLSGWLMGFFFWDVTGKVLPQSQLGPLTLDGIKYATRGIDALPVGYAQAPFTMKNFPDERTPKFEAYVLAGNVGKRISTGVPEGYATALSRFNGSSVDQKLPHGTLQPLSGWMIYGPAPHTNTTKHGEKGYENNWMKLAVDQSYTARCMANSTF